jgi:hypothetical protein
MVQAIQEEAPPVALRVMCGQFIQEFRSDPEVQRLHIEMYGW